MATPLAIDSTLTLSNGTRMPRFGLGVWQIPNGQPTLQSVHWALKAGYRHIDTAKMYGNEASVGEAVRRSGLARDKIWVTTKLLPTDVLNAERAFAGSLERLGLDYIDLYLVHWPVPGLVSRTWKRMEAIYQSGQVKAIGVSNHSVHQLQEILARASVPPTVNQVKCSPFNFDQELYDFCRDQHIAFEAYSPLTRGAQLDHPTLVTIAQKHQKSAAQLLIRWALELDMIVIPKSSQQAHIQENAQVFDFELTDEDKQALASL